MSLPAGCHSIEAPLEDKMSEALFMVISHIAEESTDRRSGLAKRILQLAADRNVQALEDACEAMRPYFTPLEVLTIAWNVI